MDKNGTLFDKTVSLEFMDLKNCRKSENTGTSKLRENNESS